MRAMQISLTGLEVEWRRFEVIAQNLANVSTTRTAVGEPYRMMRLVSGPRGAFAQQLAGTSAAATPSGVEVYGVEPVGAQARRVLEPGHPHADADGYLTYPGFDHAAEMTLMIRTQRAYEANIVAMNSARQMYVKAMELGVRS